MLRKLGILALALLIIAPGLAHAQPGPFFPAPIGPGGVLAYSNASVTAVNTANEVSMFQFVITPSLIATASSVGAAGTPVYTGTSATGLSTSPLFTTPTPLHLTMSGYLNGAAGTSVNLAVQVGAASLSLNNLNIVSAQSGTSAAPGSPIWVDVWLSPIATTTATPNSVNSGNTMFITARAMFYGQTNATMPSINSTQAITNISLASATALNVNARWAAASNNSSLTFLRRLLLIGQ